MNKADFMDKYSLTPRETEVLLPLIKGLNNNEIAKILNISSHTVKSEVASILIKLKAKNRVMAAVIAVKENLV